MDPSETQANTAHDLKLQPTAEQFDALTEALSEAEDYVTEFAIEMHHEIPADGKTKCDEIQPEMKTVRNARESESAN